MRAPATPSSATSSAASRNAAAETDRVPGKPFFFRAPPGGDGGAHARSGCAASRSPTTTRSTTRRMRSRTRSRTWPPPGSQPPARAAARSSARRGTVVDAGELRLGVVAVTDHPAEYAAAPDAPGVAWADLAAGLPEWVLETSSRACAREADVVVAFPHWGPNMTTEPARWQRRRAPRSARGRSRHRRGPLGARLPRGRARSTDGRCSTTSATRSTTTRSTTSCETTSGSSRCGGPGADPAIELVGAAPRLLRDRDRRRRRRRTGSRSASRRACSRLGSTAERVSEARLRVG